MKVEIWSDVMCPFCYIGKRRFEQALQLFAGKDQVEVEWKSYQLNPDMKTDTSVNISQYLADAKGWTLDYARNMNDHVTKMAAEVGLTYDFDRAVVANSFNAHRFSHYAKSEGLGDATEEALFEAYFTLAKNIDDKDALADIGEHMGLNRDEVLAVLATDAYTDDVKRDIAEAGYLGIQGVPFFVMNGKYAVSGAQAVPVFTQTLETAFSEWSAAEGNSLLKTANGPACGPDGDC
ncbi:DsbA family oxidoreductase [Mucilaginibacter terrenus]|uniref:DsbA family oxidoreductase n=1 Tax=Mucilaginibacter terrenus TaxID=2482727 RepID=A0A3E2NQR1_9SPHI|nr:DsbA family oxidoreductase [Mucilaginibacter terrenus]RFZ83332.1 DsbA family oxidoreductase [Mucilaginibacter terrenus]